MGIRRRASDDADADADADDDAEARDETHGGDAIGFGIQREQTRRRGRRRRRSGARARIHGRRLRGVERVSAHGTVHAGEDAAVERKGGGEGEITCPAHGSTFSMKDGTPRGEWCPKLPELPMVGKPFAREPKGIPTYVVRVDETSGEIMVDA